VPRGPGSSCDWYATLELAQAAYLETVERERDLDAPGLVRVERVEDGQPVEDELIVRRLPTYG
jgi:hypothetical protein